MNILICDDEQYAIKKLEKVIQEVIDVDHSQCFFFPSDAIQGAKKAKDEGQQFDYAFLDIEMPEMSGISLAKELKDISPDIKIVFITGYADYALEAFSVFARGYLLKPVTTEKLRKVIQELEREESHQSNKVLKVRTFGNFEVFYDNNILEIGRAKAKELFAYLIDRNGAGVSSREIAAVLWPDKPFTISVKSNISQNISTLQKSFEMVGIDPETILVRKRNNISVNVDSIDCDYFRFLKQDIDGVNAYHGEYMTNYEWAEFTLANLESHCTYHSLR